MYKLYSYFKGSKINILTLYSTNTLFLRILFTSEHTTLNFIEISISLINQTKSATDLFEGNYSSCILDLYQLHNTSCMGDSMQNR